MARHEDSLEELERVAKQLSFAAERAQRAVDNLRNAEMESVLASGTKEAKKASAYVLHWSKQLQADVENTIEADELGIPVQAAINKAKNDQRKRVGKKRSAT